MTQFFIPDLATLRFEQLPDDMQSIVLSYAAKKEAMGPHIRVRWGWDEDYPVDAHVSRFREKPFFAIRQTDETLGTISWWLREDHVRRGEFYLFERFQGVGIGTRVLRHLLAQADALRLPVRLEYLKWNPAGRLYRRNGFVPTHESDIHMAVSKNTRQAAGIVITLQEA